MPSMTDAKEQAGVPASDAGVTTETKAAKEPKAKREPKPKAEPSTCGCGVPTHNAKGESDSAGKFGGCGDAKTTSKFAPGHDAKLVGYLTRSVAGGHMTEDQAMEIVAERSKGSALLIGKLKSALATVADKKARAVKREAEKAEAAAKPESTPESNVDAEAAASA